MHSLGTPEWCWILGFLGFALLLSIYHARRSSQSIEEYFVAGKDAPWWIVGTSIVATTFAADTPLVVAGLVITQGISANWIWWSVAPSGMLGVFLFATLWRRSGCLTLAEFARIRYDPSRARALRLFYVLYHGLLRNATTLGFVNLAMAKIIVLCTRLNQWEALSACFLLTVLYTLLGGINGVMWTDFFQFFLAVATAILLAIFALLHVNGIHDLERETIRFFPEVGTTSFWAFFLFMTLYWISSTPTDCHGYAVQRLLSARNERHAVWGYLWFNIAHYVIRPWPWIAIGLAAILLYPEIADPEIAYVQVALETAPGWLLGPALASLLAAYMSTVDTHLNWSASYVVNDWYAPYCNPGQSTKHYVWAGRIATIGIAILGVATTLLMHSIVGGWGLIAGLLSGMGIVGILRWLWWRITAWTEIGCMTFAGVATLAVHFLTPEVRFPFTLLVIVPCAMLGAVIGTLEFAPESGKTLVDFVRKVKPPGPGWNRIRRKMEAPPPRSGMGRALAGWILGTAAVYAAMLGVGSLFLGSTVRGLILCLGSIGLAFLIGRFCRAGLEVGSASPGDPRR